MLRWCVLEYRDELQGYFLVGVRADLLVFCFDPTKPSENNHGNGPPSADGISLSAQSETEKANTEYQSSLHYGRSGQT